MPVGGEAVFALRVSNTGDAPGQDVVVRDTLPAGLTPVAASADCAISGQEVVCRIDELEAGDQHTFEVRARAERAAAGQTLTNRGTVTAVVPDPEPANDASEAAVTIAPLAAAPSPPAAGQRQPAPVEVVTECRSKRQSSSGSASVPRGSCARPRSALAAAASPSSAAAPTAAWSPSSTCVADRRAPTAS